MLEMIKAPGSDFWLGAHFRELYQSYLMSQAARIQALSVGHALDANAAGFGIVNSAFARAVNLMIRAEMWTLLAADKADLPFGIRVASADFDVLGFRRGDPVNVRAGFVSIGSGSTRRVVDCRTAPRWLPAGHNKTEPGLAGRLAVVATAASDRSWHESALMAQAIKSALEVSAALGDVLAKVVGRGPGSTPSGDDVLVGILAVLNSPHSGAAGARAAKSLGRAILPLLWTTSDVSGQLLRQAMKGLFSRDVHELVMALLGNPPPEQLRNTIQRVIETGATSGADTCMGLLAFAPSFLIPREERATA
jgi:Protein of unknown function (DUF2877)